MKKSPWVSFLWAGIGLGLLFVIGSLSFFQLRSLRSTDKARLTKPNAGGATSQAGQSVAVVPGNTEPASVQSDTINLEVRKLHTASDSRDGWNVQNKPLDLSRLPSTQIPSSRGVLPYIIQFSGPIDESWKKGVTDSGGVLRGYLPENAFIVDAAEGTIGRLSHLPYVKWIGEFKPEYKVQPSLIEELRATGRPASFQISLQTFAPEDVVEVADAIRSFGGAVERSHEGKRWGIIRAEVPAGAISPIAQFGAVHWIEKYVPPKLLNDFAARGNHMNVTNVWNTYGLTGSNQIIGHADTGLDSGNTNTMHPDFMGRIKAVYALGRPGNWSDTDGHGTHTAGSILGDGTASAGQFRGIAWSAQLVHQSILDAGGGLGGLPADLNDLFLQTYTNGARIHSDSWGTPLNGQYDLDSQQCDEFMWDYPDMLLVFSAGNGGIDNNSDGVIDRDSLNTPATAKNLLAVGAAENDRAPGSGGYSSSTWYNKWSSDYPAEPIRNDYISQSDDGTHQGMAAFSSHGPTDDGRFKPDIVAPGTDIISCRSHAPGARSFWGTHSNTNYLFCGGTSMSCPLTAGAAALVRQYFMDRRGMTSPPPSAALIKAMMVNGAKSITPGQYGTGSTREVPTPPRPNNVEGWGQVNLESTLFPPEPVRILAIDSTNGLNTGATNDFLYYVMDTNPVSLTLAYSDYPATLESAIKLVNDLDLLLIGPDASNHYPNGFVTADRTNNVEGIDAALASPGVVTVRITAYNVPNGPQPFALIIRGNIMDTPSIEHTPLENQFDTNNPYAVDAIIVNSTVLDTNALQVLWNTTGSTNEFMTNTMAWVTNNLYRGFIPAQSNHSDVYYYISAATNGLISTHPSNAPAVLHHFEVTGSLDLLVTGTPVTAGAPIPDYGTTTYASGNTVIAWCPVWTTPIGGTRYACTGWVGTGSAPAMGSSNSFDFIIQSASEITWPWGLQFALEQTSSVPGIVNSIDWIFSGATTQTITASLSVPLNGTNYAFAQWTVDGARQPDATNTAVNPATGILMNTSHVALALYLPEGQDSDADDYADWWEYFNFGSMEASSNPAPQSPQISHTPLSDPQVQPAPWPVSAVVTDNVAVEEVILWWDRNGDGWHSSNMTAYAAPNQFASWIPDPGTNGDHFSYFIIARDPAGWSSTNGPHEFDVAYPLISVTPTNLENAILLPSTTSNRTLTIGNTGNADLHWNAALMAADFEDNMENGTNGWSHGGINDVWHPATNRYYSSDHAWYFGYDDTRTYPNASRAWLSTPSVRLWSRSILKFRHWIDSELDEGNYAWDGGLVEISTNGGVSFEQIDPVGGYPYLITGWAESPWTNNTPCFAGSGGWQETTFDLSAYANLEVQVRFEFGSDRYAVMEGWYIDDVQITRVLSTNEWFGLSTTNGIVSPQASSNLVATYNSSNTPSGSDLGDLLRIMSDDPVIPTNDIPVSMRVRSLPTLSLLSAAHTATNGTGQVTISNLLYDADGELLDVEVLFSTNSGASWSSAWIQGASGTHGIPTVNNSSNRQVMNLSTTNAGVADTNYVVIQWSTTHAPAVPLNTGILVRLQPWDGIFSGNTVTSEPFLVDNLAPSADAATVTVACSALGNYFVGTNLPGSWTGFRDEPGAGILGYYFSLTNCSGTEVGAWTTASSGTFDGMTLDQTNTFHVWARDLKGNIGPAVSATRLILDPQGDWDSDLLSNEKEEIAGTVSTNAESVFKVGVPMDDTNCLAAILTWPYSAGRQYWIYWVENASLSPDLIWNVLTNPTFDVFDGLAHWSDTNSLDAESVSNRFYRLSVRQ